MLRGVKGFHERQIISKGNKTVALVCKDIVWLHNFIVHVSNDIIVTNPRNI